MPRVSVGRAELDTRPHILYRFYDRTGVLLYLGITVDFAQRLATHAKEKDWWKRVDRSATRVEYYDGRRAAMAAERDAIKAERPLENDQHNEWVDEEDESDEDEARTLARDVIDYLDSHDREEVLKECSTDWEDKPVSDRERDIAAASRAASRLWSKRYDWARSFDELLDLLPDGDRARSFAQQRYQDTTANASFPFVEIAELALKNLLLLRADAVLREMPLEEAQEWVAAGRTLLASTNEDHVIFGARYARLFKESGVTFTRLCNGPGEHGARCTKRAEVKTFFELCQLCSDEPTCTGHTNWCQRHAEDAQGGKLTALRGNPDALLPIAKSEPLPTDPWDF